MFRPVTSTDPSHHQEYSHETQPRSPRPEPRRRDRAHGRRPDSTILVDNFNDGNSDGWSENDFTGGRGSFDASSGSYVLETTEPIPVLDPSVGTLDADWEPSEDSDVRQRHDAGDDPRQHRRHHGRLPAPRESRDRDRLWILRQHQLRDVLHRGYDLFRDPDAPQTIIAMADPEEFPFEAGETYILEASVVNHKLTLKAWKADEPEPNQPILSLHDKEFGPESGTGLAVIAFFDPAPLVAAGVAEVPVNATIDDLTFTPGAKP